MSQRTQEELDQEEDFRASIVDGLRRAGWSREDANEEADKRLFNMAQRERQTSG